MQPCNCIAGERGLEKKIVLQEKGVVGWFVLQCEEYCKKKGFCIAIQSVYCKWERLEWLFKIVLQYIYCIADWKVALPEGDVVSQYKKCIVAEIWPRGLYCKRRLRVYCRNCIAIWCIVVKKGLGAENCIAIQLLYCKVVNSNR